MYHAEVAAVYKSVFGNVRSECLFYVTKHALKETIMFKLDFGFAAALPDIIGPF